jgi:hypothetical protein
MNINFSVRCTTCDDQTNLRVGMSNRDVQPFRFCCQTCGSPIDFTIGRTAVESKSLRGAERIDSAGPIPFDDQTNFVDLHLDFPVSFGKYVMGMTPFMTAMQRVGFQRYSFHNERLNQLNKLYKKSDEIRNLIRLYSGKDKLLFKLKVEKFLRMTFPSTKPQDINAALYRLVSTSFAPFIDTASVRESAEYFPRFLGLLLQKDQQRLDAFVDHLADTGFLRNLQLDCLELYPNILDAELPLRPALFLDFEPPKAGALVASRVSTDNFKTYKDLYKDIAEVLNRQLVVVAGLNNLMHRGDYNKFKDVGKGTPASLDEYADVPFGRKSTHLDTCWYRVDEGGAIDNRLRNAIAHFKAEYDEITQVITYYPKLEGIQQEKAETIYFLGFMRRILEAFREMHHLHHLVKAIYYYRYIMQKRDAAAA